jgi:hypothetical protein
MKQKKSRTAASPKLVFRETETQVTCYNVTPLPKSLCSTLFAAVYKAPPCLLVFAAVYKRAAVGGLEAFAFCL